MAKVTLDPPKRFNRKVAHAAKPGVRKAAEDIGERARTGLAAHRREGDAEIHVDHGKLDSMVSMTSPDENKKGSVAAAAIEFGHGTPDGKHVEGLYIIHTAARLL